ncbi:MAG: ParA family protein [Caulobacteraceae bacterium]
MAVIALKGGSGKTTVATHLALAAHLRGVDTQVIDLDPQRSAENILSSRRDPGPACMIAAGSTLMAAQFAALGLHKRLLVIDTPAGAVEDVSEAIVLADFTVLVVRPTLIDLSGLARSLLMVRRLGKPSTVVVNQAPFARGKHRAAPGQARDAGPRVHEGAGGPGHPAGAVDLPDGARDRAVGGRERRRRGSQGDRRPVGFRRGRPRRDVERRTGISRPLRFG